MIINYHCRENSVLIATHPGEILTPPSAPYQTKTEISFRVYFFPAPQIQIDDSVVAQLVSMGFDKEGCRKAVYHTKNQGKRAIHSVVKIFKLCNNIVERCYTCGMPGAKTCVSFSFKSDPSQFWFLISIIYQWIVYWWVKAVKPARVISDRGQQNARVDKVDCEFCRVRKTLKQSRRDQFISNVFHATFPDWCSFVHWFFSLIRCRTCHELGFRTYGWPRWDEC